LDENIKTVLDAIDIEALKEVAELGRKNARGTKGSSDVDQETESPEFFKHITTMYDHVVLAGRKVLQREARSTINPVNLPSV
jgi:precorrin-6B methylase 2